MTEQQEHFSFVKRMIGFCPDCGLSFEKSKIDEDVHTCVPQGDSDHHSAPVLSTPR